MPHQPAARSAGSGEVARILPICAFVLATDDRYKEWGYVAMSRGQLDNRLYLVIGEHPLADDLDVPLEPKPDPVLAITAALDQSRGQYLALDQFTSTTAIASQLSLPQDHVASPNAVRFASFASLR